MKKLLEPGRLEYKPTSKVGYARNLGELEKSK